jgi:hypothetical protein
MVPLSEKMVEKLVNTVKVIPWASDVAVDALVSCTGCRVVLNSSMMN